LLLKDTNTLYRQKVFKSLKSIWSWQGGKAIW
jgi:hypothetical protein